MREVREGLLLASSTSTQNTKVEILPEQIDRLVSTVKLFFEIRDQEIANEA